MLQPSGGTPEAATLFKEWSGYLKPDDVTRLETAYQFSEAAHDGQFRASGDPYISHPLAVANILAGLHLDPQALTAALLHDVMEDTAVTKAEITRKFGKPVAELVDGVSKLDRIEFETNEEAQAENFRKMLLAMARDVRVMLIKLADRLHNMRTLDAVPAAKRRRVARETLEIYAPIANRLGLNSIYQELEELSFHYLYPARYRVLSKALKAARGNRREVVSKVLETIKKRLKADAIDAVVHGREKHLFSIYRKMREKRLSFAKVLDVFGFRIIVKDVPSCYLVLGALHALYKPFPGKFKDYIAIPKANGYQSLHTALFGPFGSPLEIQVRTQEMHKIAEAGVASHWLYKTDASLNDLHKKTHQWLQSLLEIQSGSGDSIEFLEHLKVDLFPDEVYVFTPKGKILTLPRGATAVDFAYAVHTDIGNRCVAVKINHELMPLRTELRSGERVEIITASHAKPNPLWLNYVITGRARSHIRHFLKTVQSHESAHLGERLLNQALDALESNVSDVKESQWNKLLKDTGAKCREDLLADIGLGKRLAVVVARQLLSRGESSPAERRAVGRPVVIRGSEGMAVQFAQCCRPIPGDPIIGLINKGHGMVIHTYDCPSIARTRADPDKVFDVEWAPETKKLFNVGIKLVAMNQRGVLAKVAAEIAEAESNIDNVVVDPEEGDQYATMNFTLQVSNRLHLAQIMRALRRIPQVIRITRTRN